MRFKTGSGSTRRSQEKRTAGNPYIKLPSILESCPSSCEDTLAHEGHIVRLVGNKGATSIAMNYSPDPVAPRSKPALRYERGYEPGRCVQEENEGFGQARCQTPRTWGTLYPAMTTVLNGGLMIHFRAPILPPTKSVGCKQQRARVGPRRYQGRAWQKYGSITGRNGILSFPLLFLQEPLVLSFLDMYCSTSSIYVHSK
jgi:hypothetical protein